VLWELEFQRGLAELYRASPSESRIDPAAAFPRFHLALSLDEKRAPRADLYNPSVTAAFTAAIDARSSVPPRPVAIRATPPDARIVVDGLPIVDNAAPRTLRPGLHVIHASAPGHAPSARVVELASGQPLEIALTPVAGTALDRIGASWSEGVLDPGTAGGRKAILEAAVEAGANGVVIVDRQGGEATARVLLASSGTELRASERGATPAAAVAAALQRLDGAVVGRAVAPIDRGCTSALCSWKLWAVVGAVAVAGTGTFFLMRRDDVYRILPPM
jgi:hypothetical protein